MDFGFVCFVFLQNMDVWIPMTRVWTSNIDGIKRCCSAQIRLTWVIICPRSVKISGIKESCSGPVALMWNVAFGRCQRCNNTHCLRDAKKGRCRWRKICGENEQSVWIASCQYSFSAFKIVVCWKCGAETFLHSVCTSKGKRKTVWI